MIDLKIEEYCKNCPNFKVEQDTNCCIADTRTVMTTHTLKCENAEICAHLLRYLKYSREQ